MSKSSGKSGGKSPKSGSAGKRAGKARAGESKKKSSSPKKRASRAGTKGKAAAKAKKPLVADAALQQETPAEKPAPAPMETAQAAAQPEQKPQPAQAGEGSSAAPAGTAGKSGSAAEAQTTPPSAPEEPKSKGRTYMLTGLPGFVGARLLEELYQEPEHRFFLLIESRMRAQAELLCERLGDDGRIELLEGDITLPDCGLDATAVERLRPTVQVFIHLAAIYDLTVSEALARRVNVDGTENVLELVRQFDKLERLVHVSTCYVSGKRTGLIFEDDLDRGQAFKNHYESTKFLSEVAVRQAADTLPITIIRPAIIIGDSVTGETAKFDGPYQSFRALQMGLLILTPGKLDVPLNLVPIDFVVSATKHIIEQSGSVGKTYAIADPNPMTARDVLDLAADQLDVPRPVAPVPSVVFKKLLEVEGLAKLVGMPREVLDYSNHLAIYDCRNTLEALEGSHISCPPLRSYLGTILDYWRDRVDLPYRFPSIVRSGLRSFGLG